MSIASRYVMRQIAAPLFATIAIGLAVLLADRLVRLLEVTLGKKSAFSVVFEMLAYLVPHYLGLALPAAFFLGLLLGFRRLSQGSEVDAFLAGGVGLHQLAAPAMVLALIFTGIATLMFGFAQPHTRYAYRAVVHAVRNVQIFYLAEEGVFMRAAKHTFIVDKLSRGDNTFERVFVYNDKGKKGSETITAAGGKLIDIDGEPRPVLRLRQGVRLIIKGPVDPRSRKPLPRHESGNFKLVDTPLGAIEQTIFRKRGKDQRELTLPELFRARASPPSKITLNALTSELHRRIVNILNIIILPLFAMPFAITRNRQQGPYGFAVALVIVIAYYELSEQGALAVKLGHLSPAVGIWVPFFALALFSFWRFYRLAFQLKSDRFDRLPERIGALVRAVRRKLPQLQRSS